MDLNQQQILNNNNNNLSQSQINQERCKQTNEALILERIFKGKVVEKNNNLDEDQYGRFDTDRRRDTQMKSRIVNRSLNLGHNIMSLPLFLMLIIFNHITYCTQSEIYNYNSAAQTSPTYTHENLTTLASNTSSLPTIIDVNHHHHHHHHQQQPQPSQLFLMPTILKSDILSSQKLSQQPDGISLVTGLVAKKRFDEEEDGFIMRSDPLVSSSTSSSSNSNETKTIVDQRELTSAANATAGNVAGIVLPPSRTGKTDDEENNNGGATTLMSTTRTTTAAMDEEENNTSDNNQRIAIDVNRQQFLTHDQLSLLNATTKDEHIHLNTDSNDSINGGEQTQEEQTELSRSSGGATAAAGGKAKETRVDSATSSSRASTLSKLSRVSSFLTDLFVHLKSPLNGTPVETSALLQAIDDEPANTAQVVDSIPQASHSNGNTHNNTHQKQSSESSTSSSSAQPSVPLSTSAGPAQAQTQSSTPPTTTPQPASSATSSGDSSSSSATSSGDQQQPEENQRASLAPSADDGIIINDQHSHSHSNLDDQHAQGSNQVASFQAANDQQPTVMIQQTNDRRLGLDMTSFRQPQQEDLSSSSSSSSSPHANNNNNNNSSDSLDDDDGGGLMTSDGASEQSLLLGNNNNNNNLLVPPQPGARCTGYCSLNLFAVVCDAQYESVDCYPWQRCCVQNNNNNGGSSSKSGSEGGGVSATPLSDESESASGQALNQVEHQHQLPSAVTPSSSSSPPSSSSSSFSSQWHQQRAPPSANAPSSTICRGSCLPLHHSSLCAKPNLVLLEYTSACPVNQVCCSPPTSMTTGGGQTHVGVAGELGTNHLDGNTDSSDGSLVSSMNSNDQAMAQSQLVSSSVSHQAPAGTAQDSFLTSLVAPPPPPSVSGLEQQLLGQEKSALNVGDQFLAATGRHRQGGVGLLAGLSNSMVQESAGGVPYQNHAAQMPRPHHSSPTQSKANPPSPSGGGGGIMSQIYQIFKSRPQASTPPTSAAPPPIVPQFLVQPQHQPTVAATTNQRAPHMFMSGHNQLFEQQQLHHFHQQQQQQQQQQGHMTQMSNPLGGGTFVNHLARPVVGGSAGYNVAPAMTQPPAKVLQQPHQAQQQQQQVMFPSNTMQAQASAHSQQHQHQQQQQQAHSYLPGSYDMNNVLEMKHVQQQQQQLRNNNRQPFVATVAAQMSQHNIQLDGSNNNNNNMMSQPKPLVQQSNSLPPHQSNVLIQQANHYNNMNTNTGPVVGESNVILNSNQAQSALTKFPQSASGSVQPIKSALAPLGGFNQQQQAFIEQQQQQLHLHQQNLNQQQQAPHALRQQQPASPLLAHAPQTQQMTQHTIQKQSSAQQQQHRQQQQPEANLQRFHAADKAQHSVSPPTAASSLSFQQISAPSVQVHQQQQRFTAASAMKPHSIGDSESAVMSQQQQQQNWAQSQRVHSSIPVRQQQQPSSSSQYTHSLAANAVPTHGSDHLKATTTSMMKPAAATAAGNQQQQQKVDPIRSSNKNSNKSPTRTSGSGGAVTSATTNKVVASTSSGGGATPATGEQPTPVPYIDLQRVNEPAQRRQHQQQHKQSNLSSGVASSETKDLTRSTPSVQQQQPSSTLTDENHHHKLYSTTPPVIPLANDPHQSLPLNDAASAQSVVVVPAAAPTATSAAAVETSASSVADVTNSSGGGGMEDNGSNQSVKNDDVTKEDSVYANNQGSGSQIASSGACGIPYTRQSRDRAHSARVMGGFEAKPNYWCWQAALMNDKNEYLCGGALIGTKWVLTAAHCVTQHLRNERPLFVRLGQHNLNASSSSGVDQAAASSSSSAGARTIEVKTSYVHHNHNGLTLDNDIALLRLLEPVELSSDSGICVVCLPERSSGGDSSNSATSQQQQHHQLEPGKRCTVTGYGFETEAGPAALRVRQTELPIVADQECQKRTSAVLGKPFSLPASSFCAGGELGEDACHGDGGSPLSCLHPDGYYELAGIVSWGYKCGSKDLPGLYSKVSTFVGWINQIVSVNI